MVTAAIIYSSAGFTERSGIYDKTPSMYEMEGVLPGHAIPMPPVT